MKKTGKFLSLLLVLFFVSCGKEQVAPLSEDQISVNNELSLEVQKLAYQTMTETEQRGLWLAHLSDALTYFTLTPNQSALVTEGYNLVSSGEYLNDESNVIEIWKSQVSAEFNIKQQYILFSTLGSIGSGRITNAEFLNPNPDIDVMHVVGGPNPDCSCSRLPNHDFCGRMNSGGLGGADVFKCGASSTCAVTSSGCGWWWKKACSGNCYHIHVPSPIFNN